MPSRRSITVILAFWLATTGYVAYRDLWPRLFASGPPPVFIDLADEAAQSVPVRWTVSRNGQPIGRLITRTHYNDADDSFTFTHNYRQLRFDAAGAAVLFPDFTTHDKVSREGQLVESLAEGNAELLLGTRKVADAVVKVASKVANNQLTATIELKSFLGDFTTAIDPIPVPAGSPLNPLQPFNRLSGVKPGQRWVVHEFNPFDHITSSLAPKAGVRTLQAEQLSLVAEVLHEAQELERKEGPTPCWVIEYRREEVVARTWVRVADGKVMKQEAFRQGEHLSLDRDE